MTRNAGSDRMSSRVTYSVISSIMKFTQIFCRHERDARHMIYCVWRDPCSRRGHSLLRESQCRRCINAHKGALTVRVSKYSRQSPLSTIFGVSGSSFQQTAKLRSERKIPTVKINLISLTKYSVCAKNLCEKLFKVSK